MIEAQDLHKRFGDVVAVHGVSFTARDGEVTELLGPNGAGKTTSLRMLCGLVTPDSGWLSVDGVVVGDDPLGARRRIGVLPDTHGLYPRLTAREHACYFGRLQGLGGVELEKRIDALFEVLEMGRIADRRVEGFSHGERMKVALARAMVHGPGNIVLDEPTNGLDVMGTRAMRRLIRRLRDEGKCVLFSSHIMQEVSALCDAIVIIANGEVAASDSAAELRSRTGHENLEDVFVALTGIDEVGR